MALFFLWVSMRSHPSPIPRASSAQAAAISPASPEPRHCSATAQRWMEA